MLINTLFQLDICVLNQEKKKKYSQALSLLSFAPQQAINHLGFTIQRLWEGLGGKIFRAHLKVNMAILNPPTFVLGKYCPPPACLDSYWINPTTMAAAGSGPITAQILKLIRKQEFEGET